MAIIDVLKQIADAATIVPLSALRLELGEPLSFGLTPPFPDVIDTVQPGDVNAVWLTKDVRFADALGVPSTTSLPAYVTDATNVIGGQPVVDPEMTTTLPLPIPPMFKNLLVLPNLKNNETTPPTPPKDDLLAGTPGVLGQFAGVVPIPVQLPLSVSVTWTVRKRGGGPAVEGKDFLAPKGLTAKSLDLVFLATAVADLLKGEPPKVTFEIVASVEVMALGLSSGKIDTPAIPLDIPAILGIPTVAALFRHGKFAPEDGGEPGSVLLAVPNNAVIRNVGELALVLDTLRSTLQRLQSFKQQKLADADVLGFLLGLSGFLDALNNQPRFQFVVDDQANLHNIIFAASGWRIFPPRLGNTHHAGDETSSVMLIGIKDRSIKLWGDADFKMDDRDLFAIELKVSLKLWASILDLRHIFEKADIPVTPPETIVELQKDPGFSEDLNDKISSLDFEPFTS